VVFKSKLDAIISGKETNYLPLMVTDKNHIPLVEDMSLSKLEPQVVTNTETTSRNDGNNVDIDNEMAQMAENTAYYSALAQLTSDKLSLLQTAIKG
jgi:flagellar basal-body rod protein FlgB